ncbi:MAG: hypothetical protein WCN98_00745 [Verrucomicrobiaceae bacterium]
MGMLTARNHQMMLLMVHADCQNAEKPQSVKHVLIPRRNGDSHRRSSWDFSGSVLPAVHAVHRGSVRHHHPPDRVGNGSFPRHHESHPACHGLSNDLCVERHLIHIDEMLAKCIDVDFGPIRLGVIREQNGDFLDCRECRLSRFDWRSSTKS